MALLLVRLEKAHKAARLEGNKGRSGENRNLTWERLTMLLIKEIIGNGLRCVFKNGEFFNFILSIQNIIYGTDH